eukprot:356969-Chlamydomonas_euryale.AAC.2
MPPSLPIHFAYGMRMWQQEECHATPPCACGNESEPTMSGYTSMASVVADRYGSWRQIGTRSLDQQTSHSETSTPAGRRVSKPGPDHIERKQTKARKQARTGSK